MGNEFIQFDWPFYGRPEGGKKGAHACKGGCTCWETVRVCVDNRVHDKPFAVTRDAAKVRCGTCRRLDRVGCSRNVMLAEGSVERLLFFSFFIFFFGEFEHASLDLLVWHAKDFRKKPFSEIRSRSLAKAVELCDRSPCPPPPPALFLAPSLRLP